jgi:hypothetical protein
MTPTATRLFALLASLDDPAAAAWALHVRDRVEGGLAPAAFADAFAAAARRLGKAELTLTEADGVPLPPGLTRDELGRLAMLAALPEADQVALASDCFSRGDTRERRAVLRALPLLPAPARFVDLAASACRTHVVPVFEAICCESPYPASFFPDATFDQMVIKALFLGVALGRVVGLAARTTPELQRMAHGYASERRAAGRSVPADIDRHFGAGAPAEESP